jgi:hypothetical protein
MLVCWHAYAIKLFDGGLCCLALFTFGGFVGELLCLVLVRSPHSCASSIGSPSLQENYLWLPIGMGQWAWGARS